MARVELARDWMATVGHALAPSVENAADWMADEARRIGRQVAYGEGEIDGHYIDGIEPSVHVFRTKTIAKVGAYKFTSHWVEDGTTRMGGRHVLALAAEASGLPMTRTRRRNRRGRRRRR